MSVEFLEIIAAISEESEASLLTADPQAIIYNEHTRFIQVQYISFVMGITSMRQRRQLPPCYMYFAFQKLKLDLLAIGYNNQER